MKETPILFTGAMVRAIREGRKTQTRRIMKPQPASVTWWRSGNPTIPELGVPTIRGADGKGWAVCGPFSCRFLHETMTIGRGGTPVPKSIDWSPTPSRLWVREASRAVELESGLDGVRYAADDEFRPIENTQAASEAWAVMNHYRRGNGLTVTGIHMPRWASRITLEIVSVRVERLNDISANDCRAEGVMDNAIQLTGEAASQFNRKFNFPAGEYPSRDEIAVANFRGLWVSINGASSWSANPWVWVIEFKMKNSK